MILLRSELDWLKSDRFPILTWATDRLISRLNFNLRIVDLVWPWMNSKIEKLNLFLIKYRNFYPRSFISVASFLHSSLSRVPELSASYFLKISSTRASVTSGLKALMKAFASARSEINFEIAVEVGDSWSLNWSNWAVLYFEFGRFSRNKILSSSVNDYPVWPKILCIRSLSVL